MTDELKQRVGNQLAFLRKSRNLTQANLASQAGISERSLQKLEKGESAPEFNHIVSLCEALSVDASVLFASGASEAPQNPRVAELVLKLDRLSNKDLDLLLKIIDRLNVKK